MSPEVDMRTTTREETCRKVSCFFRSFAYCQPHQPTSAAATRVGFPQLLLAVRGRVARSRRRVCGVRGVACGWGRPSCCPPRARASSASTFRRAMGRPRLRRLPGLGAGRGTNDGTPCAQPSAGAPWRCSSSASASQPLYLRPQFPVPAAGVPQNTQKQPRLPPAAAAWPGGPRPPALQSRPHLLGRGHSIPVLRRCPRQ